MYACVRAYTKYRLFFRRPLTHSFPRGSIYTLIMELGPQYHNGDGLLGPSSITALGYKPYSERMNF